MCRAQGPEALSQCAAAQARLLAGGQTGLGAPAGADGAQLGNGFSFLTVFLLPPAHFIVFFFSY